MPRSWIRRFASSGLAWTAALLLGLAGCGGGSDNVDEADVLPEPGTNLTANSSTSQTPGTSTSTAPTEGASAASTTGEEPAPVKAEGWGTLKGRVIFGGNSGAPKVLVAKGDKNAKDAEVCAINPIESERLEVDPETKGVRYAIVYIPKPTAVNPEAQSEASQATVEFDQHNCVFEPHVLGVTKGATIELKSNDPVAHNVNSKLQYTKLNSTLQAGQSTSVKTEAAERRPGKVVCDIHPWMSAYWMVVDNPYIAVTDEQGNYELKNVPAGTQKVVVWQEAATFVTSPAGEPVNVQADGETNADFTIDPAKVSPE